MSEKAPRIIAGVIVLVIGMTIAALVSFVQVLAAIAIAALFVGISYLIMPFDGDLL